MISNAKDGFLQQEADRRPDAPQAQSLLDQKDALNQLIQQNQEISSGPVNNIQEAGNPGNRVIWSYNTPQSSYGSVVVDTNGYTYAGGVDNVGQGTRWVVRKYTPDGSLDRVFTSDPTPTDDDLWGVAVDTQGNVIVVGSENSGSWIRVEKFSPLGQSLWVYQNHLTSGVPTSVAVDTQGNIYAGGAIRGPSNDGLWWMTKLSPNGIGQWGESGGGLVEDLHHARNPGAGGNSVWAMAVGPDNSVYALGFDANGNHGQWRLEKRNAQTGDVLWTYISDPSSVDADMPFGVAVDQRTGDAYISGHDGGGNKGPGGSASGRVRVEKISSSGQNIWTFVDDQGPSPQTAAGITLDPRGFLYLTGQEDNGAHYWIRKLTVHGAQVWYYSNRSNQAVEEGMAIAMAPDGSVRVVGYEKTGSVVNARIENINGDYLGRAQTDVTRDASGRVIEEIETIFSASNVMVQRLTRRLNLDSWSETVDVFRNNIFVQNQIVYGGVDFNNRSIVRSRSGNDYPPNRVNWSYRTPIPGSANAIAVDSQGHLYAAGFDNRGSGGRGTIQKLTPTGQFEQEFFADPTSGPDNFFGVAVDSNGNVIGAGNTNSASVIYIEKFSPSGQSLWVYQKDTPNASEGLQAVAVDAAGNIYVGGGTDGHPGIDSKAWVAKLSPDGQVLWEFSPDPSSRWNPGAASGELVWAVALGPDNSFFDMMFDAGGDNGQWRLEKRNATTGELIWTYISDPSSGIADMANAIIVDPVTGDAFIGGHDVLGTRGPGGAASGRIRVERISSQGQNIWTFADDTAALSPQTVAGITLDGQGSLYLTGMEENGAHYWIRKLTEHGAQVWYYSNRSDQPYEEGMAVTMAPDGSLLVAGYDAAGWRIESVNGNYLGRTQNDVTRDTNGRITEQVETIYDMSGVMVQKITQRLNQNSWSEKIELFRRDRSEWNQTTYSGIDLTNRSTVLARTRNYRLTDSVGNVTDDVTENRNTQGTLLDRASRHYDIDVQSHVERFETWNNGRVEWTENRRQGIDPSSSGGLLLSLARGYQIFDAQNKLAEESRDILGNSDNQIIFTRTTRYNAQENPTQHQIIFYNETRQVRETAQVDFSYNAAGNLSQRVVTYLNPAGQVKSRTTQRMDTPESWVEGMGAMSDDRWDWTETRYTGRFQIDRNIASELWKGFRTYNPRGQITQDFAENDYLASGRPALTYSTVYSYDSQGRFTGQTLTTTRYDEAGNIISQSIF